MTYFPRGFWPWPSFSQRPEHYTFKASFKSWLTQKMKLLLFSNILVDPVFVIKLSLTYHIDMV